MFSLTPLLIEEGVPKLRIFRFIGKGHPLSVLKKLGVSKKRGSPFRQFMNFGTPSYFIHMGRCFRDCQKNGQFLQIGVLAPAPVYKHVGYSKG